MSSPKNAEEYRQVPQSDRGAVAPLDIEDGRGTRPATTDVLRAVLATILYCVAGPSLIFLNKYILADLDFPYGSALSLLGVAMSSLLSGAALLAGAASSDRVRRMTPRFYATRILPIGVALGLCLATGNVAYLYNSVAFVQILKAFAPVVLLAVLFATRLETPSTVLVLSIFVISGGTAVAVEGEMRLSASGALIMLASEFFEAVKLVMMQILLVDKKYGAVEGLAVIGPAAVLALAATTLLLDDYADAAAKVRARPLPFLAASLGGVAVNLATNLMVAATSALTLRITSLLRNIGVVLVSALVVRDAELRSKISPTELLGFGLSVCGVALYQHARRHPASTLASVGRDLADCLRAGRRRGGVS